MPDSIYLLIFIIGCILAPFGFGWALSFPKDAIPPVAMLFPVCVVFFIAVGVAARYWLGPQ